MGRRKGAEGEQQEEAGMRCNESEPASHYINSTRNRPHLHLSVALPITSMWHGHLGRDRARAGCLCYRELRHCPPQGSLDRFWGGWHH
jgi:hypothetical protein